MGIFKDFFKDIVDEATGGMISSMELDKAIRELQQLENDTRNFDEWFKSHSKNYIDLRDKLNTNSYKVDRRIFHANWITGKAEWDDKSIDEENNENNRREKLIENAIKKQSCGYTNQLFKDYLSKTENRILDSYNTFCIFQNEMSYLCPFQKDIVDSIYLAEVKELLGGISSEIALKKIKDFTWQIERHKTPAGHAIVLLMLAKFVYHSNSGFAGDIKAQIENAITFAEDTIIDNTYKTYLTEDERKLDAEVLLQIGKDFFISGEPEKAFAYFLSASKKGNIEAQYRVGLCFEKGYGVYINEEKAVYWYKKSAESNNPISIYYLATVYQRLLPENKRDYNRALELYKIAFRGGVAEAAKKIGDMYAKGMGVNRNDITAAEWYEKGADMGSPWAMYYLYLAYMNGTGVELNNEIARQWFEKCVKNFELSKEKSSIEVESEFNRRMLNSDLPFVEDIETISPELVFSETFSEYIGNNADIMKNNVSVYSDEMENTTNDFYSKLWLPGCDSILNQIAREYYNGSSVISKDIDKAIEWFERSAIIGDIDSLDRVSYIYLDNYMWHYTEDDIAKFLHRAAEYGCSSAMGKLGLLYYYGKGVVRDKVIANTWILRAAKMGNKHGQQHIAFEILSGETGMPKDIKEARYWLSLATEQGNEECQKKLIELDHKEKEKRKKEWEKEKENLTEKKQVILSKISNIEKNIDAAQNQQEENALIREKGALEKEIAILDERIDRYDNLIIS